MEIPYGKEEREGEKRQFKTKQKKKTGNIRKDGTNVEHKIT